MSAHGPNDPVVVVTSDSHCGPLPEQMREYCPKDRLDDFDAFYRALVEEKTGKSPEGDPDQYMSLRLPDVDQSGMLNTPLRNVLTDGGWDAEARLADMDRDGVTGEVIYHGLNAGQHVYPMPWSHQLYGAATDDLELVALGRHIYNQWLADFCSVQPERRVGLAQLPMWDPEAALKELERAADAGLRGVNFPRAQDGIPAYNEPVWEPFWSLCEERTLPLSTHAQTDAHTPMLGALPGDFSVGILEMRNRTARPALHQLVFGGVFERHPDLSYVLTEVTGLWWKEFMYEMDEHVLGMEEMYGMPRGSFGGQKLPSEYCASQVFIGASMLAPFELEDALANGYASQLMFGSDYPHPEGSWCYPRSDDDPSVTKLALRDALWDTDPDLAAGIAGETAARIYGLDLDALRAVAARSDHLTFQELGQPVPDDAIEPIATRGAWHVFRRHSWAR